MGRLERHFSFPSIGGSMSYTQIVLDELKARYPEQPEFIQAATE